MKGLDAYTVRARVVPVALVVVPAIVLLGGSIISSASPGVATGIVTTALAAIAGQLGRDLGKALEPRLWAEWGGAPAVRRLRYRDNDERTVDSLHERVRRVLDEPLPSVEEERRDPAAADRRYDAAVRRLIAATRDQERFKLVFEENVNYGQRRNLRGLRRIGMASALVTLVAAAVLLAVDSGEFGDRALRYGPGLVVALAALVFWWLVVKRAWVRVPAEAYADRLVEAVDSLKNEPVGRG